MLDVKTYARRVDAVEAIEITQENIQEVARVIGGTITVLPDGDMYILKDLLLYSSGQVVVFTDNGHKILSKRSFHKMYEEI